MHSEPPGRYINSVSDLYETDEIEFLLDDIRELEPVSCKPEDIQDFEIAGSGTAECAAGGCRCDSPVDTVNSWDSHSHYKRRDVSADLSLYSGVIIYCDHRHLRTTTGLFRALLAISTVACLACLCTSGTVKVGLFMLPLASRIRFMMFVSLLSLLVTCLFLFLDVSHMVYLFPFNWGKINTYFYVSLSVLFVIASSLIFHMIFLSEAFAWVPKWSHQQLLITGCLGYVCSVESAALAVVPWWSCFTSTTTEEKERRDPQDRSAHNYKSLATAVPKQEDPMGDGGGTYLLLDDVQPCSSKSTDPYRIA